MKGRKRKDFLKALAVWQAAVNFAVKHFPDMQADEYTIMF
jgi:hypothetical protein